MRPRSRWLAAITVAITAGAIWLTPQIAYVGNGFYAKQLCSGVFVSGRSAAVVARDDLEDYPPWLIMKFARWRVYEDRAAVETHWMGLSTRYARFVPGTGCGIVPALPAPPSRVAGTPSLRIVASQLAGVGADAKRADNRPWPLGEHVAPHAATPLDAAIDGAFNPRHYSGTRAVVVVHRGRIVAERYAEGFTAATPLPGWSMAKSAVNAIVGMHVHAGALTLDTQLANLAPQALPDWSSDERRAVTLRQTLTMTTGLAFNETYWWPFADAMTMLFGGSDAFAIAGKKALAYPPGSTWYYSSGTTNILTRALLQREQRGIGEAKLFERLGMTSAVLEYDLAGTPIGSSFMYATARDWARLGWLYAADGMWAGERVLPDGWVAFSRAPAPHSNNRYAAHFWLADDTNRGDVTLPADAFHATGHAMQRMTIIPSRELVVVRLGHNVTGGGWQQSAFVAAVLGAL